MLLLAQRWSNGPPCKPLDRQVVEALVIARSDSGEQGFGNWKVWSAFYDPAAGQTLATAFHWWDRGRWGLMPFLLSQSLEILSQWALPANEMTDIKTYTNRLLELHTAAAILGDTK